MMFDEFLLAFQYKTRLRFHPCNNYIIQNIWKMGSHAILDCACLPEEVGHVITSRDRNN